MFTEHLRHARGMFILLESTLGRLDVAEKGMKEGMRAVAPNYLSSDSKFMESEQGYGGALCLPNPPCDKRRFVSCGKCALSTKSLERNNPQTENKVDDMENSLQNPAGKAQERDKQMKAGLQKIPSTQPPKPGSSPTLYLESNRERLSVLTGGKHSMESVCWRLKGGLLDDFWRKEKCGDTSSQGTLLRWVSRDELQTSEHVKDTSMSSSAMITTFLLLKMTDIHNWQPKPPDSSHSELLKTNNCMSGVKFAHQPPRPLTAPLPISKKPGLLIPDASTPQQGRRSKKQESSETDAEAKDYIRSIEKCGRSQNYTKLINHRAHPKQKAEGAASRKSTATSTATTTTFSSSSSSSSLASSPPLPPPPSALPPPPPPPPRSLLSLASSPRSS
ncbi:hypothetical protein STEG23_013271 [Scotinomys teguina]